MQDATVCLFEVNSFLLWLADKEKVLRSEKIGGVSINGMGHDISKRIRRYKYLPFDEGSLRIITDGTIKFTSPSKVNDPFDCAPEFSTYNTADYLNTRPDLFEKAREKLKLSPAQLSEEKPTMIKRLEMAAEHGSFGPQCSK